MMMSLTHKGVRVLPTQDILFDIFECIEMFFRCLEVYTEAQATPEMMVTMAQTTVKSLVLAAKGRVRPASGPFLTTVARARAVPHLIHNFGSMSSLPPSVQTMPADPVR
jgi:hypothetical protein